MRAMRGRLSGGGLEKARHWLDKPEWQNCPSVGDRMHRRAACWQRQVACGLVPASGGACFVLAALTGMPQASYWEVNRKQLWPRYSAGMSACGQGRAGWLVAGGGWQGPSRCWEPGEGWEGQHCESPKSIVPTQRATRGARCCQGPQAAPLFPKAHQRATHLRRADVQRHGQAAGLYERSQLLRWLLLAHPVHLLG